MTGYLDNNKVPSSEVIASYICLFFKQVYKGEYEIPQNWYQWKIPFVQVRN